jgi:hypothetical protein
MIFVLQRKSLVGFTPAAVGIVYRSSLTDEKTLGQPQLGKEDEKE